MLPGAAGFSGARKKGLEEPGLVELRPARAGASEGVQRGWFWAFRSGKEPNAVVKKQQAIGRRKFLPSIFPLAPPMDRV